MQVMLNQKGAGVVLKRWGIDPVKTLPHAVMAGSPERSLARTVIEDSKGNRYILEQLAWSDFDRKNRIAAHIDRLHGSGLSVSPYLKGEDGCWIQRDSGFCWQLVPLVQGLPLDRKRYWKDGWRGKAVGHFLADLSMTTRHWEPDGVVFSLSGYIEDLIRRIERHDPEYLPEIEPIADFLRRRFYPVLEEAPPAFCHGDPHPLNTIWGERHILAVIDWEFCGWKPMLYDAALVVGCIGAEASDARQAGFISSFLETLGNRRVFSEEEMALLPLFVLAVRFGWLSEWLRKKDVEMIEFELFYMDLLMTSSSDMI